MHYALVHIMHCSSKHALFYSDGAEGDTSPPAAPSMATPSPDFTLHEDLDHIPGNCMTMTILYYVCLFS